jgi:hypothetical protein
MENKCEPDLKWLFFGHRLSITPFAPRLDHSLHSAIVPALALFAICDLLLAIRA